MGIWDLVGDYIRENQIAKTNRARRGVKEYQPSEIGGFIDSEDYGGCSLVSGKSDELRCEVIQAVCAAAANASVAALVLHRGNSYLQNELARLFKNSVLYHEIGTGKEFFDPLYNLPPRLRSQLIVEAAPEKFAIGCAGGAYVDAITDYLEYTGKSISLPMLSKCPHGKIPYLINQAAAKNALTTMQASEIQSNFTRGQDEALKVKYYIEQLYNESTALLPPDIYGYQSCVSLFEAVQNRHIMSIDVTSDSNSLLLGMICCQARKLLQRGIPFVMAADNIAIRDDNGLKELFTTKANNFGSVVSASDLFAMCDSSKELFDTLVGKSNKWFLFQHGSDTSAKKWSEALGSYMKIEATRNLSRGNTRTVPWIFDPKFTRSDNMGVFYSNKDEAIIRPEVIRSLKPREGFVYNADCGELAHVAQFNPPVI